MNTPKPIDLPAGAAPNARRLWPKLLILALILGFAAIATLLLPRGFSDDLSLIGKGGNIVVLVHNHDTTNSMELMITMNKLRDEYDGRVKFLVADKFAPEGIKFVETYAIDSVALVFFAPDGARLDTLYTQQDENSLRHNLNQIFHF